MVEQNAWRNYQTKLLGGGLLLIAIIIIAALLSHSNHATPSKQEVELTLQPQSAKPSVGEEPIAQPNPMPPVSSIEISKVNTSHAIQTSEPVVNPPVANRPEPPATLPIAPRPVTATSQNQEAMPQPPTVTKIKPMATATHPTALPHIRTLAAHNTKAKPHKQNTATPSIVANKKIATRLLAISKSHYTIQLLGVNSKRNAMQFIKNNRLQQKAMYYQTLNHSKPWHVVIYGNFQTKDQAHAALHKLPPALLKIKPFVRSYAEVHTALAKK
jgi:septal ring-binding cell division protein DamX